MNAPNSEGAVQLAQLRERLRVGEIALVDKYASRIDTVERARPTFVAGEVLGAATGIGR